MRSYLTFVAGLLALLVQTQSLTAQMVPFPQNDSVKLRLEIEIRGVLSVTQKSATITNKETIFEWVEVEQRPDPRGPGLPVGGPVRQLQPRLVDKVWALDLDENLRKIAKALHGNCTFRDFLRKFITDLHWA